MAWQGYINRSLSHLRDRTSQGGKSTVNLDLGPEGKGRFYGSLSSDLREGRRREGVVERGGYAGLRSKSRTTMFGPQTWDTSLYDYLRLRVRSSGDGMRYFVNIQTDGPVRSDLFQHRLWLPPPSDPSQAPASPAIPTSSSPAVSELSEEVHPHRWTDILIPLSDFTLTNSGDLSEVQIEMYRSKIRTVGLSVLGPGEGRRVAFDFSRRRFFGHILTDCVFIFILFLNRYELGIESIDALSSEEVQRINAAGEAQ
ncbi:NADH dehydrogenase [ubiquinone] 1 alpha subcomplex assembly factor 1, partial [Phenoliferia sp. Uapishka_3]